MERTYKKIEIVGISEDEFWRSHSKCRGEGLSVTTPCRLVRSDGDERAG